MQTRRSARPGDFLREPPWWFRDIVLGVLIGAVFLAVQMHYAEAQQRTAERLENTRYVRERSSPEHQERPFASLDLVGQDLEGLFLFDADFSVADLSSANIDRADLEGSLLSGATLTDASLRGAHLAHATLGRDKDDPTLHLELDTGSAVLRKADLRYADLSYTKLYGVDFTGASLEGADLTGACFDDTTTWPTGFTPPPPPEHEDRCGIAGMPDELQPPRSSRHTRFGSITSSTASSP